MTDTAPKPPPWPCPTCNAAGGQPCRTLVGPDMGLVHELRKRPKRRNKRKRR